MAPTKHKARVRIREITYSVIEKNILDQPVVNQRTAYGPGRPEIDPVTLLGPEYDPNSTKGKEAVENYKYGELVELVDEDYLRLRNGGAILDVDEAEAVVQDTSENSLDVATASIEEITEWIKRDKPNANETVQASGNVPEVAEKLLQAEANAGVGPDSGPRKGVVDGLSTVIGRGGGS